MLLTPSVGLRSHGIHVDDISNHLEFITGGNTFLTRTVVQFNTIIDKINNADVIF